LQNIGVIHEDLNIRNVTIEYNAESKIKKINIIDFGNSLIYRFDGKLINNYSDKNIIEFNPRLHFGSLNLKAYDLLGFILSLYENIKDNDKFNDLSDILRGLYIFNMDEINKLNINQIKNIFRIVCMENGDYEGKFGDYNYKKEYNKIIIHNESNRIEINFRNNNTINQENYKDYFNSSIRNFYPIKMKHIMDNFKIYVLEEEARAAPTADSTITQ
jgi:hypothetical protein